MTNWEIFQMVAITVLFFATLYVTNKDTKQKGHHNH